jgi:hypothetical protein
MTLNRPPGPGGSPEPTGATPLRPCQACGRMVRHRWYWPRGRYLCCVRCARKRGLRPIYPRNVARGFRGQLPEGNEHEAGIRG